MRQILTAIFFISGISLLWPTVCMAAEAGGDAAAPIGRGLAPVDWLIIVLYAITTLSLGWYYSRRQETTSEYFTGSGHMNPVLVGVSLFATLLSTISYLSMPGEMLGKGPVTFASMLALPLIYLIVAYGLLPVYMKQHVTSAYELLEARLGLGVRLLGAGAFILLRLVWMSLLVYLTANAMALMIGVDKTWVPTIALVTGLIAVIYTSLGGLRAVVITDLMQTILLFGGALLVLGIVTVDFGGFGWWPTEWQANWDHQPLLPINPETGAFDFKMRVSVFGSIISVMVWYVCTTGGDQTSVQRFMATSDVHAARKAYATQLTVAVVVGLTLATVGLALLRYYEVHPEYLPAGKSLKNDADQMFPLFIAYQLPVGISGLVVSAMFAAAMSSIDSGVNSITAVVMSDFLDRFGRTPRTERGHVLAAKALAFTIGAVVVIGSSFMGAVPGNITAVTQKTANLLTTPIFGLFFYALFVPFAKPAGVVIGTIVGTVTASAIAFSGPLTGEDVDPISFQWIAPAALIANIVVGCAVSFVLPAKKTSGENLPDKPQEH